MNLSDLSVLCEDPSSDTVTRNYWILKDEHIIYGRVIATFLLLYEIVGLPWNVSVVVTIIKEKLFHNPTVILLLNMIAADLVLLVYALPVLMSTGFSEGYVVGTSDKVRCKTCRLSVATVSPFYSLLFTVALMSLDRFVYIYKPFQYERAQTKYLAFVAVVVTALISLGLGLGSQFDGDRVAFNPVILGCAAIGSLPSPLTVLNIVIGAALLVVIIVSNICFACIVLKNIRAVYSCDYINENTRQSSYWMNLKESMELPRYQKQVRLYRMFCALLITSLITCIPALVIFGNYARFSPLSLSPWETGVCFILIFSQVVLHPIIESLLVVDVREPLIKMITCGLVRRKDNKQAKENKLCKACIPCASTDKECYCSIIALIEAALIVRNELRHCNNIQQHNH